MDNNIEVLIIDDDKDIAAWYRTVLTLMGFEVETALSARQALACLAACVPSLILLDLHLGQEIGGEDILYQIRANSRFDQTRVIVITGYPTTAEMVTNLADLIMIKPVGLDQLKTLISRIVSSEVEPKSLPFRDPVTLLFNKEFFYTRLELAFERSKRRPEFFFAVIAFQVQPSDPSGQTLPPEASAAILVEVADRLKQKVRPTDTVARVSGWKFFTLHEDMKNSEDVEIILARLKQVITQPVLFEKVEYPITIQYGVALAAPNYKQPADIFEAAELALKKTQGL
ncbi:MAG: diguanylate cyclase [Anaerolineaceae bacterium]|nr:diguanylate cyclase [Anaerolineaceae bacterium]